MRATSLVATLAILLYAPIGGAAPLTGSGAHLPVPAPNPAWPPGVSPTQVQTGPTFTGVWGAGTHPDWAGGGGYSAVGPIPGAFATGSIFYDFTTMPLGYLPAGTFFIFGDVDGGSGNPERFHIEAFDSVGSTITTEWLGGAGANPVYAVRPTGGTGGGGAVLPTDTPGWDWNVTQPNEYLITGATVGPANPNVAVALETTQPIYRMLLEKPTTHYGFGMQAPAVPEPACAGLLAALGAVLVTRRSRR